MKKTVEEMARIIAEKWCEQDNQPASFQHTYHGFIEGFRVCQKIMAQDSDADFEEWFDSYRGTFTSAGYEEYVVAKDAWQAATLAAEKKHEHLKRMHSDACTQIEISIEQESKLRSALKWISKSQSIVDSRIVADEALLETNQETGAEG